MGTKIIEQGSTAGGIAKVQYLDESGNVLYEVNDSDKIFKMVNGKISGLAGTGINMVVADSIGNLSIVPKNTHVYPFTNITTIFTDIFTIDFACFLSIAFYNLASPPMQGIILIAVTPTGIVNVSSADNTGLGVTVQYNAGKIQLKTTSGTVSGSINRLG